MGNTNKIIKFYRISRNDNKIIKDSNDIYSEFLRIFQGETNIYEHQDSQKKYLFNIIEFDDKHIFGTLSKAEDISVSSMRRVRNKTTNEYSGLRVPSIRKWIPINRSVIPVAF